MAVTFKEFIALIEAIDPDKYESRATGTQVELFLGRMQPIHNGHDAIIKKMKNPVVVLVKGAKSSQDKERNPFDEQYQTKLIKMLNPKVDVTVASTGYIPDMVNEFRKAGKEVTTVYAGADRINTYRKMIESFNRQMPEDKRINVKFKETPRVTSATTVRNAIRGGDYEEFKKLVPAKLHGEWETMRKIMGE